MLNLLNTTKWLLSFFHNMRPEKPWNRKTTFHQCVFDVVIKKIDLPISNFKDKARNKALAKIIFIILPVFGQY